MVDNIDLCKVVFEVLLRFVVLVMIKGFLLFSFRKVGIMLCVVVVVIFCLVGMDFVK